MKVSVSDITTAAAINRGTFYLHYQDKYNLLSQMEESLLEGLELHLLRLKPDILLLQAEQGQISRLAVEVFRYIQINAECFQVFLGENNHYGFHKRLKQFFVNHFGEKMIQNEMFFRHLTIPKDYFSAFSTSAFLGLIECVFFKIQKKHFLRSFFSLSNCKKLFWIFSFVFSIISS